MDQPKSSRFLYQESSTIIKNLINSLDHQDLEIENNKNLPKDQNLKTTKQQIEELILSLDFGIAFEDDYITESKKIFQSTQQILSKPLQTINSKDLVSPKKKVKAQIKETLHDRNSIDKKFQDFSKVTIQVSIIKSVEFHPQAKNLYIIQVDIGNRQIQICASLVDHYSQKDLIDKKVLVITNLKKRKKMMGIDSNGLILGVTDQKKEKVKLLFLPNNSDIGSILHISKIPHMPTKEFGKTSLTKLLNGFKFKNSKMIFENLFVKISVESKTEDIVVDFPDDYQLIG